MFVTFQFLQTYFIHNMFTDYNLLLSFSSPVLMRVSSHLLCNKVFLKYLKILFLCLISSKLFRWHAYVFQMNINLLWWVYPLLKWFSGSPNHHCRFSLGNSFSPMTLMLGFSGVVWSRDFPLILWYHSLIMSVAWHAYEYPSFILDIPSFPWWNSEIWS